MKHPEAQFAKQIWELAMMTGWSGYHTRDSRKSKPGFPDYVFWRERVIFVEVKGDKTPVMAEQDAVLTGLRYAGAEVYLWRAPDLDEPIRVFKRA